ncbi:Uncharacterised protein [uncultured archaeon]|nr:Uncharacterised protein [uncultured archaeon]
MSAISELEGSLTSICNSAKSSTQQGAIIAFVVAVILAISAYKIWTGQKKTKNKTTNPPMLAIALAVLAVLCGALGAYWWLTAEMTMC